MVPTGSKKRFEGWGGGISEHSWLGRRLDPNELLWLSKQLKSCIWLNFAVKSKLSSGPVTKVFAKWKKDQSNLEHLRHGMVTQEGVLWFAVHEAEL